MNQKVTPKQCRKILSYLINPNQKQVAVPFIMGAPGIGKSAIVKKMAKDMDAIFIDLRLSQLDSVDLRGVPKAMEAEQIVKWFAPEFMPFKGSKYDIENKKVILFLDEFNRASFSVLQAVFQLVYDRKIGEHVLIDNCYMIAAGNMGIEDGTDVMSMDAALKDRFVFVDMEYNLDDWIEWATNNNINPYIISMLSKQPRFLDYEVNRDDKKYLTPRTWERFSNLINQNLLSNMTHAEMCEKIIECATVFGTQVIDGATAAFIEHVTDMMKISAQTIIDNYMNTDIKIIISNLDRSQIYSLVTDLSYNLKKMDITEEEDGNITSNTYTHDQLNNIISFLNNELEQDHLYGLVQDIAKVNKNIYILLTNIEHFDNIQKYREKYNVNDNFEDQLTLIKSLVDDVVVKNNVDVDKILNFDNQKRRIEEDDMVVNNPKAEHLELYRVLMLVLEKNPTFTTQIDAGLYKLIHIFIDLFLDGKRLKEYTCENGAFSDVHITTLKAYANWFFAQGKEQIDAVKHLIPELPEDFDLEKEECWYDNSPIIPTVNPSDNM